MANDDLLLEARPSWWNFFWNWVFFWLIVPVFVAFWKRASLVLRLYDDRIVLEKGVLSKNIKELFVSDIRAIDTSQSLIQRIFGIGDVKIATAGTSGYEDIARGLPNPARIRDLIINQRRGAAATDD